MASRSRSAGMAGLRGGGEFLFQERAGPLDAGAHGAFGDAKRRGDLGGGHLFERGEDERLTQIFGKRVDEAMDARDAMIGHDGGLRRVNCRGDGVEFHAALLSWRTSAMVLCQPPDNTC